MQWTVVRKFQLQIIDCLCASAPLFPDDDKLFFDDLARTESLKSGRPPWKHHLSEEYPEDIDWQ